MNPRQFSPSMPRRLPRGRLLGLLCGVLLAAVEPAGTLASLPSDIEQVITQSGIPRSRISVSVRDTSSGRELVDVASSTPRIPASNMKLLSTGAAISSYPLDHQFRTRLLLENGRIVIIGNGDPALADPDLLSDMRDGNGRTLNVEGLLDLWVKAIRKADVTQIDEVIVDDRIFDRDLLHADWPRNQIQRSYCPEVSGLNFHRNILELRPEPRPGHIALGESPSAPFMSIHNEMTPGKGKAKSNTVDPHRQPLSETITVRGTVVEPQISPVEITVHDPAMFTGRLLADRLAREGIKTGSVRRASKSEVFDQQHVLFDVVTPMQTVVKECNHESKNLYAEAILKHLGHSKTNQPGSWSNGSEALAEIVRERTGHQAKNLVIADGSGMSRRNRVSPELMTRWLATFADGSTTSRAFQASLPSPGSGTLERRFANRSLHGCDVVAKTGYINGVSALSGLVIAPGGQSYAFSVIGNDLKNIRRCKHLQESIVEVIAEDIGKKTQRVQVRP
ncbi:MAG: D-alanyl-D-alanine carboxypeptidase/D-alanyl-D-alanine-endopeptidase [Phycisphaerales bacterium]|nr:D-alanyl-D-alanine carboxypeptidase/D-alanyl-D-alanine-endopeptidase [Phycisphaerales bacterium]